MIVSGIIPISSRRNLVDIEVVKLAVKEAIVGETAKSRDRVERIKWSVAKWFSRIATCSLAVARDRDSIAAVTGGDVTGARRYRALVKGGDVGLDANVDCIVAKASVSY